MAARKARIPPITLPEDLPVSAKADELRAAIEAHQVVVVAGATGSGKTTQLPKLCLAAGLGSRGLIGVTQPRRLAAKSIARRLAQELSVPLGELVGWQVRFTEQVSEGSLIKVMTDGILLAETRGSPTLDAYEVLILDEAHERSLNIDFLLGLLKPLLARRRDLKLIVTSATIDTARFAEHFGGAPVIEVEGRSYPVEVRYRPPAVDREADEEDRSHAALLAAIDELGQEDRRGDILVFLPGEREIREAHRAIERCRYPHTEVLALYARLSGNEQDRVFQPGALRRIVLATNVAETSITVPRIRFVIDTGTARISRFSPRTQVQRLHIEPISQASADQRAGRCGRTSAGVCIRLYDEDEFARRPRYTDPEILRSSLAGVVLRMLDLKLGDPLRFPYLDAPDERAIREGYALLAELGAIDGERKLTPLGRQLAQLPVDVRHGRMLLAAGAQGCLREALAIVSALAIQDPRDRPADRRDAADAAHALLMKDPNSDFLGWIKLWEAVQFQHAELSNNGFRDWAKQQFLSPLRLREWRELHRQLLLLTRDTLGLPVNEEAATSEAVHRALLTGLLGHIGVKDEKQQFHGARGRRFVAFPGSYLAKAPPKWVMAAALLDTQRLYGLTLAKIDPAWVEAVAPPELLHARHYDPLWDPRSGRVYGFQDISLYGVAIVTRRRVGYESVDPTLCRELFLRHAMVRGEVEARHPLLRHNAEVREEAKDKEEKLRRRGLLKSESVIADWFAERLPASVLSVPSFLQWWRQADAAAQARLKLTVNDLVIPLGDDSLADFPDALRDGPLVLPLAYRFDPSLALDGATLTIRLDQLGSVTPARLSWLVPGLLREKVVTLLRALPKPLRRHFVPAPDFAQAFLEAHAEAATREPPLEAALAAWLTKVGGVAISPADYAEAELPAHLKLHLALIDERGQPLDQGDDLLALKARHAEAAQRAFAAQVDAIYHRDHLTDWPPFDLPRTIRSSGGAEAWPALSAEADAVHLRSYASATEADAVHADGVLALAVHVLGDTLRYWRRNLPLSSAVLVAWAPLGSAEALRTDILATILRDRFLKPAATVRGRKDFAALLDAIRRETGEHAAVLAREVEDILRLAAELRRMLVPQLIGYGRANYDDARMALDRLVHPDFVRETPRERLKHFPRYLKALKLRAERLKQDAKRDQQKLLDVLPFEKALERAGTRLAADHPAVVELRWAIEELRVSLFAQELGTAQSVSPKRLAGMVAALG